MASSISTLETSSGGLSKIPYTTRSNREASIEIELDDQLFPSGFTTRLAFDETVTGLESEAAISSAKKYSLFRAIGAHVIWNHLPNEALEDMLDALSELTECYNGWKIQLGDIYRPKVYLDEGQISPLGRPDPVVDALKAGN